MGLKIAVYSIAKNEALNVEQYVKATQQADAVFVLDTGSSDKTVELLKAAGINVQTKIFSFGDPEWKPASIAFAKARNLSPWRFDAARNAALRLIPEGFDAAVILDLDERLVPGWREALEAHLQAGATRIQATYTFNFNSDGSPDLVYFMDRAHALKNYSWKGVVHEHLVLAPGTQENLQASNTFKINHHQNAQTSRKQYLPLLELAVFEEPNHDRNSHYLGREYYYYQRYEDCIKELTRHLSLPTALWEAERAASMKYIAWSHRFLNRPREAQRWFLRAIAEWPEDREPWLDLGMFYNLKQNFEGGYFCAKQALKITERPKSYLSTAAAWGAMPYDLAASTAWNLKLPPHICFENYIKAMALEPNNAKLKEDLALVTKLAAEAAGKPQAQACF